MQASDRPLCCLSTLSSVTADAGAQPWRTMVHQQCRPDAGFSGAAPTGARRANLTECSSR